MKIKPATIADLRKEYSKSSLDENKISHNPFQHFESWWKEAVESRIEEANAMVLATVSTEGIPSMRMVLLKGFDEKGFVFYTNYNSTKAQQLQSNPNTSILFYWKELERQVRITGIAKKISLKESILYFNSRPAGSNISAWVSPQSKVIQGRDWLEKKFHQAKVTFTQTIKGKPPHWGGYRVAPHQFEFWQGRPNRLHDRILYTQENNYWKIERLAP